MSYATEAEYRDALVAYRALHEVFYRFHKSVCPEQHASAATDHPSAATDHRHANRDTLAVDERDYDGMVGELLPALARSYAGPRQYLDRLAETLRELGVKHAASRKAPFDALLTHQAYVDVDNILQDLLRERERYPGVFDEAFAGDRPHTADQARRSLRPLEDI
jgi:hypothetical protein